MVFAVTLDYTVCWMVFLSAKMFSVCVMYECSEAFPVVVETLRLRLRLTRGQMTRRSMVTRMLALEVCISEHCCISIEKDKGPYITVIANTLQRMLSCSIYKELRLYVECPQQKVFAVCLVTDFTTN